MRQCDVCWVSADRGPSGSYKDAPAEATSLWTSVIQKRWESQANVIGTPLTAAQRDGLMSTMRTGKTMTDCALKDKTSERWACVQQVIQAKESRWTLEEERLQASQRGPHGVGRAGLSVRAWGRGLHRRLGHWAPERHRGPAWHVSRKGLHRRVRAWAEAWPQGRGRRPAGHSQPHTRHLWPAAFQKELKLT